MADEATYYTDQESNNNTKWNKLSTWEDVIAGESVGRVVTHTDKHHLQGQYLAGITPYRPGAKTVVGRNKSLTSRTLTPHSKRYSTASSYICNYFRGSTSLSSPYFP